MTTRFKTYLATPGQRWDTIAYLDSGDPFAYQAIIEANPEQRAVLEFSEPVSLRLPVDEAAETSVTDPALLPPWRR